MLFTNNLADGDRQRAMNKLRVPPLVAKVSFCCVVFVDEGIGGGESWGPENV